MVRYGYCHADLAFQNADDVARALSVRLMGHNIAPGVSADFLDMTLAHLATHLPPPRPEKLDSAPEQRVQVAISLLGSEALESAMLAWRDECIEGPSYRETRKILEDNAVTKIPVRVTSAAAVTYWRVMICVDRLAPALTTPSQCRATALYRLLSQLVKQWHRFARGREAEAIQEMFRFCEGTCPTHKFEAELDAVLRLARLVRIVVLFSGRGWGFLMLLKAKQLNEMCVKLSRIGIMPD